MILPTGSPESKIMIIIGYPLHDDRVGVLTGSSGWELDKMLKEAGLSRQQCFVTSMMKQQPQTNDEICFTKKDITPEHELLGDKWVRPIVGESFDKLMDEIRLVNPSMIIALGDLAMWAVAGKWGMKKWRGSQLLSNSNIRILPTYTPKDIFASWELRSIVVQDLRTAAHYVGRDWPNPDWRFTIQPSFEAVMDRLLYLQIRCDEAPLFCSYDIETLAKNISCIGLAWSAKDAICIPFMKMGKPEGYFSEVEEAEIVYRLYKLMTHPNFRGITQNGLFDSQYLYRNWNFMPRHYQDTMISHHVLFPTMQKSLDFICSFHNEQYIYWKDDLKEWRTTIVHDEVQYWNYNCEDCCRTWEASRSLQSCVDKMGLRKQHDFQQSLFMPVHKMMNTGVNVDRDKMKLFVKDLKAEAKRLEEDITYIVGYPLNPRSPAQMKKFFYEEMKQKKQTKRTVKGAVVSCDSAALEKISTLEPLLKPLIEMIEQWRSVQVFINTFLADKRDVDGRLRCSYNVTGAYTFRFSSSENPFNSGLNLQNIPKGDE